MAKQSKSQAPPDTPLRFAALIRVSTERQEKQGESLRVQKQQIEKAVESLGGEIVGWFGGQEHATPGYEKQEIDRLLADAQRKRFNAFICSDADRWSRDNQNSERGLEILLNAGVRFFIQDSEYDLLDPNARLFLGVSAVIGHFFAANQKKKSIDARISRAQRGIPSSGLLPYGRLFDKETEKWSIDESKRILIEQAAQRYLQGEGLRDIAPDTGMDDSTLQSILMNRCGDTWEQHFKPKHREAITVVSKIPRLLDEKTIQAIHAKAQANRTFTHGQNKHPYLLSRMIFCATCSTALFGQTNSTGIRYYRHLDRKRMKRTCGIDRHFSIVADEIEELVMLQLFDTFGNAKAVQQAVEKASGDMVQVVEYQAKLDRLALELKKIEGGRQRVLDLVIKGTVSQEQAEAKLTGLTERESRLREEKTRLGDYLDGRPSPEQIKAASQKVSAAFKKYRPGSWRVPQARMIASSKPFSKMSWEEKRALCEMVFSGKTADGKRMGVYVEWDDKGSWTFSIHGHLIEQESLTRWSEKRKRWMKEDFEEGHWGYRQKELLSKGTISAMY